MMEQTEFIATTKISFWKQEDLKPLSSAWLFCVEITAAYHTSLPLSHTHSLSCRSFGQVY